MAKPLGSVIHICKAGHAVVFDSDGSYIINKITGEINWLREEHGNFMLNVWIPRSDQVDARTLQNSEQAPFGRQP